MFSNHIGEIASLLTAIFWTFTALAFTDAGKRIGSLAVNFWRLIIGILLLSIFSWIYYGMPIPRGIPFEAVIWLAFSGVVGIFFGDLFLFKAFVIIGPRVALLIMSLSPPMAAFFSWITMGETLSPWAFFGMGLTLFGIIIVILKKSSHTSKKTLFTFRHSQKGILFAFLGAIGQASGLVMSKIGVLESPNAFSATQIRVLSGMLGFVILISLLKRWGSIFQSLTNGKALLSLSIGSFFGPFLGISFCVIAASHTKPGIVQTTASINPILMLPFSISFCKEKITWRALFGAIIAISGVMVFFLI